MKTIALLYFMFCGALLGQVTINQSNGVNGYFFEGDASVLNTMTTKGVRNLAIGNGALTNIQANNCTAVGISALSGDFTGFDNTAVGYGALWNITGDCNTGTGDGAGGWNTNGAYNTYHGYSAGRGFQGSNNTVIGALALFGGFPHGVPGGSNNIAIGYSNAWCLAGGDNNIFIGNISDTNTIESGQIYIGTAGLQTTANIAGVITGNGGGLTNVPASSIVGGLTTNITGIVATNTFTFSNGILISFQ